MSKPEVISKGRYAIHQTPEGEGVITYLPDGEEEASHHVVPKGIWTMMMKMLHGEQVDLNPMSLMKLLLMSK